MATAPTKIRLYHIPLSPFCRKVRLVAGEKRMEVELVEEKYWEHDPDFLRRNPLAKVPVARIDGRTMVDSQAICEYLDEVIPDPAVMPQGALDRYEVRRICAWFDDSFYDDVTARIMEERVWKKVLRRGYPDSREVKAGLSRIKFHLDEMHKLLEERRWLAGNSVSLADFTAAAHLSCLDYISDVDWNRSDTVRDWYATLKSRPAFRAVLADNLPGMPPSPQYAVLDF